MKCFFQDEDLGGVCSSASILFYLAVFKETITGVLVPTFDMFTDLATAVTHFIWGDWGWGEFLEKEKKYTQTFGKHKITYTLGTLTLVFVWLPGFVVALAIAVRGLKKEFTFQRSLNYLLVVAGLPFLYPIVQVMV